MRLKTFLVVALLGFIVALSGCSPPQSQQSAHSTTRSVLTRQVKNINDDSFLYWYIIYANAGSSSCPCYVASSPTPVTSMSSLNFTQTPTVPAAAGNSATTQVAQEQTAQEQTESLPEDVQTEMAQAEAEAVDSEAVGDGENDTSMSDSGSDAGDSGGDYGGDSGGGDSGGGGGE